MYDTIADRTILSRRSSRKSTRRPGRSPPAEDSTDQGEGQPRVAAGGVLSLLALGAIVFVWNAARGWRGADAHASCTRASIR